MRVFYISLIFLLTTLVQAQEPITKTVGEFTTLKVYDLINVELIKSTENKVEIFGKNAKDVVVVNKNGILKIRMKLEQFFKGDKTEVKLYFTTIDIIDANEGAFISSNETFKQFELDLRTQEGGHIKLKTNTKINEIRCDSGGIVELTGQSRDQNITLSTGGIFLGKEIKAETSKVSIRAGGEANVNVTQLLDIKIRAGGDVNIYNKPDKVIENKVLGGRITYIE